MAKTIPYVGQLIDIAPYDIKLSKVSVGPSTAYDVNTVGGTGAYPLWNVPAGLVAINVLVNVTAAASDSDNVLTIGDCVDHSGFFSGSANLADTVISSQFIRASAAGTEYCTGKEYTAADVISMFVSGSTLGTFTANMYLKYSLAGQDTN
jgi:hypothetical protein